MMTRRARHLTGRSGRLRNRHDQPRCRARPITSGPDVSRPRDPGRSRLCRPPEVLTETITRNNSATFIKFLALLDQMIDPGLTIHLVLDNGSSHTSKATRAWLAAHPRFQIHWTPKHASWLNQVELFFSTLTRRLLRRGDFTSRADLADKIDRFVLHYDEHDAKPYRWTYDGTPLKAA